ncbi:MAG: MFS transporter [Lachnospiraceae bacterium]|nr:MFS transporter [Lachnospiraceae bacterium]
MKKQKSRKFLFIIAVIILLFFASIITLYFMKRWIVTKAFSSVPLYSASYASYDTEGNLIVVGNSGKELTKLSPEYKVLWTDYATLGSFNSAADAVADGEGNIYVHDVVTLSGVRLKGENVIKFDPEGNNKEVIKEIILPKESVRKSVVGMIPKEKGIYYAIKSDPGITLYDTESDEQKFFFCMNAEKRVLSCVYDEKNNKFYYTTFDGKIYKFNDGADDDIIYDSDDTEGSIPQYISLNGRTLYCNDIGLRDIFALDLDSLKINRFSTGGDLKERYIDSTLCAYNGLVSVSGYNLTLWGDEPGTDGPGFLEEAPLSGTAFRTVIISRVIIGYVIIFLLLTLFYIIKKIIKADTFTKIALVSASVVALLSVLFIVTLFPEMKSQVLDEVYAREKLAANVVNSSLPMDAFLRLNKPSDFMNEDYEEVQSAIRSIFFNETNEAEDLYCVIYRIIDGTVTCTYTMEDICVVYPYDFEYEGSDQQYIIDNRETITFSDSTSAGSFVYVNAPLVDENDDVQGIVEIGTDMASINDRNRNMLISLLINVIAVMVVAFMLVLEFMYYIKGRNEYNEDPAPDREKHIPVEIFRFVVFLVIFFTNLTCTILPIYSLKMANNIDIPGVSSVMLSAIPISIEVVSGAVFSAIAGPIMRKLGPKLSIIVSCICFSGGLLLRAIPNIISLILGGLVLGAGWGIILILVNVLIAVLPDEEKDRGYAYYTISALSGANCAVVLGGLLIQWIPYWMLFTLIGVTSVVLYIVCRKYLIRELPGDEEEDTDLQNNLRSVIGFVIHPSVITFFILVMIPALICGYYLNYLFPIIGSEWGLSETYISYAYILSGLVVLLFGSKLTAAFSKTKNAGLALSAFVHAGAFILVAFRQDIPSLIISIALVGLAESLCIQLPAYFTDLPVVEKFGFDKALGVYSLVENGAQSIGSFVFGIVLIAGLKKGLMAISVIIVILAVMFFISSMGFMVFSKKKTGEGASE